MTDKQIQYKKKIYPISTVFTQYLKKHDRSVIMPISYLDLLRFDESIPVYDDAGDDTLWLRTYFTGEEREEIEYGLKKVYSILHVDGDDNIIPYLNIDAIDFCTFGNTKPFRIKVRNILNDNYVYFYVKQADASRVYGLELEEILSPNQVIFLVEGDTLIEEHIFGIPGDVFIKDYLDELSNVERSSVAKEFVKFNERCFVRLLGDMRSYNYVIVKTYDFDRIQYRFRAIDFDQQSYEGEVLIYHPYSFKENKPLVEMVEKQLTKESIEQYKREERALIAKRAKSNKERLRELELCMMEDKISLDKNVALLRNYLYKLTKDVRFKKSENMGEILNSSLDFVRRNYENINLYLKK